MGTVFGTQYPSLLIALALVLTERARLRVGLKPVPVLCLLVWVWSASGAYAGLISAGLLLSAAGDVLLEGGGERSFMTGLVAFLGAHVAYITAFTSRTTALEPWWAVPVAVYGGAVLAWLWPHIASLRMAVLLYVVLLCAMVWRAAVFSFAPAGPGGAWVAAAGAALFALSDTLLAHARFVRSWRYSHVAVMIFYWMGQLGIACSVFTAPKG